MQGALLRTSDPIVWPRVYEQLSPGAHLVLLGGTRWDEALGARQVGFQLRDTVLILAPGGPTLGYLFRRPCSEGTVVENVLRYGTGGLNIGACRVGISGGTRRDGRADKPNDFGWENMRGHQIAAPNAGRWPSNLVLVHAPGCTETGTQEVLAPVINRFKDGMKPFGHGAGHAYETSGGGLELRATWDCRDGCPVRALDEQSGTLRSGDLLPSHHCFGGSQIGTFRMRDRTGERQPMYGDQGGASRFFPQFRDDSAMLAWFQALLLPPGGRLLV